MAANVPDPMEHEREQPRLTSAPKIDHGLKTPFDDCKDPAKYLFKQAGEQGLRDPSRFRYDRSPCLSYCCNGGSWPQGDTCPFAQLMGIRALKFKEAYSRMAAVLPCERAAVQELVINEQESTGQICEYEHDDILLYPSYKGTGNEMAIARAARDAMSKHGHDDDLPNKTVLFDLGLPKTTLGSIDRPKFRRIISGSCKLVLPEFAGTSTVGSSHRLEGMMPPLVCAVEGSAQTGPDHMVEPDDLKLDSGASNHVVGEKTLLQGYQNLPRPWPIHVADGYPLEVVGVGSIITKDFFIPKVYRVKGLKSNLISVSQLATAHGLLSVFDGGKCEVLKRSWERVGGGFLQANGIYKLSFLEVPEADGGHERA